jgi:hypothetical protein
MTQNEIFTASQIISEMLIQLLKTDEDIFLVTKNMMAGAILANSQSKNDAIENIASLAASLLSVCESYSKDAECHWRQDGETVQ